jgi:hypothetical protein
LLGVEIVGVFLFAPEDPSRAMLHC